MKKLIVTLLMLPFLGFAQAPTVTSVTQTSATVGSLYSYNLLTSDPNNDVVTITSTTLPSWLSLTTTTITSGSVIAPNFTLVSGGVITDYTVDISTNYTSGDVLSFTASAGITGSFDSNTGSLTLTGTATRAEWETLLRTVTITLSASSSLSRTVDFNPGNAVGLVINGVKHYYEVINNGSSISWGGAKTAAGNMRFNGLEGYLATITSQAEQDFIESKISADTWIGASDSAAEHIWKWMSGPEAGLHFFTQTTNGAGGSAVNGEYNNWNTNEPNDHGSGEDVAHLRGTDGLWNDYPQNNNVTSYLLEYGGMPNDTTSSDLAQSFSVGGLAYTLSGTPSANDVGANAVALNLSDNNGNTNVPYSFNIQVNCIADSSTTTVTACDSYTWNQTTYTSSGIYTVENSGNNYSLDLSGSNDIVTIPNNSAYEFSTGAISMWFNFQSLDSINMVLAAMRSSGSNSRFSLHIHPVDNTIGVYSTQHAYFYINYNDTLNSNEWYYLTANFNTTSTDIYINGQFIGTINSTIDASIIGESLTIGEDTDPLWIEPFNGYIEGVELWNTTLSISEIQQYKDCPPSGSEAGLVGYWNFETGSGNIVNDLTSLSNNGAITGATWSNLVPAPACGLLNSAGCDSTSTLDLTINYTTTSTTTVTACDSYTWIDGVTYTSNNNTATYTLTNVNGCDSVVTLDLTINNSNAGIDVQTACDSYTWIDGVTYTSNNNTATHTLTNVSGCDSIVTLDLTITNSTTSTTNITACDNYTWNGITYSLSGIYTWNGTNSVGCDSTATLNLTINHSTSGSTTITSCDKYFWDGVTYTATGVYTNTYTNANGCDSIHALDLTINYSSTHTQSFAFSNGGSVTVGTSTYTTPGTYTDVLTNAVGCDSTITTTVVVYYYNNYTQAITICDGESVSVNGNTYTTNGVYVDTILVANAPDSIMETTLIVLATSSLNSSISICDGESYSVGSSVYTTAGVYTDVLTNAVGCDSIVTTTLSVLPSPSVPVVSQLFSTTLTTGVYDAYQWYRDGVLMAGETNQNLNIWQSGMYSVVVFNADGCGTESAGFPFGVTAIDEILLEEFSAYPNPTRDVLHLTTPDVLGKDYVIEVYDFIGRKLFEMDNAKLQLTRPLIDISKLAPANYKLFIRYADGEIWNTTINKQ